MWNKINYCPGISEHFVSVKQFNPNCELLDGFRKEECEFNKENLVMISLSRTTINLMTISDINLPV